MKALACTLVLSLAFGATTAGAQFYPGLAQAGSIRQLLEQRHDYQLVTVRGRITGVVEAGELYAFTDGTASILLKADHKHWPHGVTVAPDAMVEVSGEFDYESSGGSKLKIFDMHPAH